MPSCLSGSAFFSANQATLSSNRNLRRHDDIPSYLSTTNDSGGNASLLASGVSSSGMDQKRRRAFVRRTLVEVLNEALELLEADELSDSVPPEEKQQ